MWSYKNIIEVLEHSLEPFILYSHLCSQLENRVTAGFPQVTADTRTTTAVRHTAHGLRTCMLGTPHTLWVATGPPRLISTRSGRRHACSWTPVQSVPNSVPGGSKGSNMRMIVRAAVRGLGAPPARHLLPHPSH